jgi:hypothetical protein
MLTVRSCPESPSTVFGLAGVHGRNVVSSVRPHEPCTAFRRRSGKAIRISVGLPDRLLPCRIVSRLQRFSAVTRAMCRVIPPVEYGRIEYGGLPVKYAVSSDESPWRATGRGVSRLTAVGTLYSSTGRAGVFPLNESNQV